MTRGGGVVQTPPKKDDIIYEQPLTIIHINNFAMKNTPMHLTITGGGTLGC